MTTTSHDEAAKWRQRYEQERQAREQAEQRSGRILANMSHELRTPLHGVLGMVELMAGTPLGDDQRDKLVTIRDSALVLRSLVDELLDHTSLEQGLVRTAPRPVDVVGLLNEAAAAVRIAAGDSAARLSLTGLSGLPRRLDVDGSLLRKVVDQVLSYALAAAETHAELQAGLARSGHDGVRLCLQVTHDGPDPGARREAFFVPLALPETPLPCIYGGLGLGLPIARRLAGVMGGALELVEADGHSAVTLRLQLPVRTVLDDGVGGAG